MSAPVPTPAARGTIGVTGCGTASGAPDVARVLLTATALRPSLTEALAASEDAARRVRTALAATGVAAQDAATRGLAANAEYEYDGHRQQMSGYRAEHRLALTLRGVTTAGRVLGDALAAGGDDVRLEDVSFRVEDDAALRELARAAAWADAVGRASQLAGLAGRELGPVEQVVEGGSGAGPEPRIRAAMAMSESADLGIEAGAVSVSVSVSVVWALI